MAAQITPSKEALQQQPELLNWLGGGIAQAAVSLPFDRALAGMVAAGLCLEALCLFLGLSRDALLEHIVRLGLRTPSDLPIRRTRFGWSVEDTQLLIASRITGVHPDVIGPNLSSPRSANAVRSKARRLGVPPPPRRKLFRPDPAQLSLVLGTAEVVRPLERTEESRPPTERPTAAIACVPESHCNEPRPHAVIEQREPLIGSGSAVGVALKPAHPNPHIPATEEEVDLSDLTWLGTLKTRREARAKNDPRLSLYTNRAAVWAVGMLAMSGLHWHEAAKRAGMSPATFRTVKSRCLVPTEPRRGKKAAQVFDEEVARETQRRSGFIVRRSLQGAGQEGPLEWFWVHKNDHRTRFSPLRRPRRREHNEPRLGQQISIVTREVLDAEARMGLRASFASRHASVVA